MEDQNEGDGRGQAHCGKELFAVIFMVFVVIVQPPYHAQGKRISLLFSIRPKEIVGQFVVHGVDPTALGVVFSPPFPIFGVN